MTTVYRYTIYGLNFQLPFPCPLLTTASPDAIPDVEVEDGPVPRQLAAPAVEGLIWQAEPGRYLLRGGQRAGRFLVEEGRRITLTRSPVAEDEMLVFHFLDSVLAAVLRQRGFLVLHANAAVIPSGAIAVSGLSGAGKSTTLAALLARGCAMLADDITVLRLSTTGCVEALPGVPQFHLCEDAAEGLGQDISGLARYPWRRMKAAVPANSVMATAAAPLQTLYLLMPYAGNDLQLLPLSGAEKFAALQDCIYGPLLPEEHPNLFPLFAAVTEQVAVYRCQRPAGRWTVTELVDCILEG